MSHSRLLQLLDQISPSVSLAIRADDPHLMDTEEIDDDVIAVLIKMVCVSRQDASIAKDIIDGYRLLQPSIIAAADCTGK